jgi:hypothetical protein
MLEESHIRALGEEAYGRGVSAERDTARAYYSGVEDAVRWILDGQVGSRKMSVLVGALNMRDEVPDRLRSDSPRPRTIAEARAAVANLRDTQRGTLVPEATVAQAGGFRLMCGHMDGYRTYVDGSVMDPFELAAYLVMFGADPVLVVQLAHRWDSLVAASE